ncbi:hypothetical protein JQC92_15275 [Shewanella sp. 202IG2-18]|uniref:hypothetical protein n=1 Tax=Parashewanella hymeniacidonis TaxID=2807618 RepID=UPI00196065B5|nr:hypothetical protein [Parashewanella hymeniacidonis]MBM7073375.1 hypothetical protein [Parashewanella hymeniacidonis]
MSSNTAYYSFRVDYHVQACVLSTKLSDQFKSSSRLDELQVYLGQNAWKVEERIEEDHPHRPIKAGFHTAEAQSTKMTESRLGSSTDVYTETQQLHQQNSSSAKPVSAVKLDEQLIFSDAQIHKIASLLVTHGLDIQATSIRRAITRLKSKNYEVRKKSIFELYALIKASRATTSAVREGDVKENRKRIIAKRSKALVRRSMRIKAMQAAREKAKKSQIKRVRIDEPPTIIDTPIIPSAEMEAFKAKMREYSERPPILTPEQRTAKEKLLSEKKEQISAKFEHEGVLTVDPEVHYAEVTTLYFEKELLKVELGYIDASENDNS